MKRFSLVLSLLLLPFMLFAASVLTGALEDPFESEENLARFDFSEPTNKMVDEINFKLITTSPGGPLFTWFGHTSLEVELPSSEDRDYNWGVFSFSDDFYLNFTMGRLYYSLIVTPMRFTISEAEKSGRELLSLDLDLTPEAKVKVIEFLNYNAREENSVYLYHFYFDNCATRVRDIYNAASGGEFKKWAQGINTGMTYRGLANRYLDKSFIASWVLNFIQGGEGDEPLTLYEACFLPDALNYAVELFQGNKAEALLESEKVEIPSFSSMPIKALLLGLAIALLLWLFKERYPRLQAALSFIFFFILALLSCISIFLMCFTAFDVFYLNESILFVNPLLFVVAFQSLNIKNREKKASLFVIKLLTCSLAVLLFLKGYLPSVFRQDNFSTMFLTVPSYLTILLSSSQRRRKAPHKDEQDR